MNSAILEKQLQRLADALSEFDDALVDAQMKFVPSPNMLDIQRRRLLAEIDNDLSDGSTLRIRFSKTDQEGTGEHLYLCEDTRQIVQEWIERSGLTAGYLFRRMTARGDNLYIDKDTGEPYELTDDGVRKIIKSCAARVGLTDKVSGHSLRIGTAVSLAQSGASLVDMQVAGRWKSSQMPAYYAKAGLAERGAIARFKDGKR